MPADQPVIEAFQATRPALRFPLTPEVEVLLAQMPLAIHIVDRSGATVFRNAAREAIWGGDAPLDGFDSWRFTAWREDTGEPMTRQDWPISLALASGSPQPPVVVRFARFDGGQGYMSVFATPLVDSENRTVAAMSVAQDITAQREAESSHRFIRELMYAVGETTPNFIYAKDLDSRMIYANSAVLRGVGKTWDQIRGLTDAQWHDDAEEGRRFMQADSAVIATGRAVTIEEPMTLPGGPVTFLSTKSPLFDARGEMIGMFGISVDITPQKTAEAQRRLLTDELKHRVKNTLALVQSMARYTLRAADIDPAAWREFEARLVAMARSHDTLTNDDWAEADLGSVIGEVLRGQGAPFPERFDLNGEPVRIDGATGLAIALAVHELGANAAKYGALAVPGGRVAISWSLRASPDGDYLDLVWRESGGPPVNPPQRRGFGSRLIEMALGGAGENRSQIEFLPDGVRCVLRARLRSEPRPDG